MKNVWFKDCKNAQDKEKRKKELLSYRNAFESLSEVLTTLEETTSSVDYECPSWSHKQADQNGANRMLQKIKDLINLKD